MFRRFPAPIVDYKLGRRAARAGAFKKRFGKILRSGLPDFSRYSIPKRGEMNQITTKRPQNITFGR
jgi:hypothetical protein